MRIPAMLLFMVPPAVSHAQPVDHLDRLKDPCLQTPLAVDGKAAAVILPGEGAELQAAAARLRQAVKEAAGAELPIVSSADVTDALLREKHVIALGDCSSNSLIGRLYAMRLCFVDGVYPGKGEADPSFDLDSNADGTPDLWTFSAPTGATHELRLDTEVFRSPPSSVHLTGRDHANNARACVLRNLDVTPGHKYRLTVWYRGEMPETGYGLFHVDFYTAGSPGRQLAGSDVRLTSAAEWTEAANEFTVPQEAAYGRVLLYLYGEGDLWYDDVALYEEGSDVNLLARGNTGAVAVTVHDPLGYQRNVVVLGASEPAGFAEAVDLFLATLEGEPTAPDLMEIRIGDSARLRGVVPAAGPDDAAIAARAEATKVAVDSNAFVPVRDAMQGTKSIAINWTLTGDDRWAKLYGALWRVILGSPSTNAHGPMEWTFNTLDGWDLMDECPALPDGLKLEIVNRLLLIGVRNEQAYGRNVQSVDRTIVDGHQLDQGLCLYMHGLYFSKYYRINAHWMDMARPLIQLGAQTPRVHDSYAYGPILGNDFLSEYALKTGDMGYFENGNCRRQAEWQMLCTDSINGGGTFGDDGAWRGSLPTPLLYKANWYTRDDTLKWFLRGDRPPIGMFANDRPAQRPNWLLGVASLPLHERLYQVASATRRDPEAAKWKPEMVPPNKAFDKLAFRSGFDERDQYLLLDGISVLSHGHEDGNSILRFTDNGRLFLTEGHYVETTPRRHNTLLVARNGESWSPPPLTSLEAKASLDGTCMVRTLSSSYNGVNWQRSILWSKERAFVFIDRLTALEEGDYDFELLWRSLGDARLSPEGVFTVDQMGESMTITRLDESDCRLRETLDYHGANYYGSYPYCTDGLVKELRQIKSVHLTPGEGYTYRNVVQTTDPAPFRRLSDTALAQMTADGRVEAVLGVDGPPFAGGPDTDAAMWSVSRATGRIALAGATRFVWGEVAIRAEAPANLELDVAGGSGWADCPQHTRCRVVLTGRDAEGADVEIERGAFQCPKLAGPLLQAELAALDKLAAPPPALVTPPPAERSPKALPRLWQIALPPQPRLVTSEAGTRVTCNPAPLPTSTWTPDYKIDPQTLSYQWDSIVLWKEDQPAQVSVQLPQGRAISRIAVRTMWTNNSAQSIRYRLGKLAISAATNLNGPWQALQTFEETADHPIPSNPEYAVDTPGLTAQFIRLEATPQPGAALFLKGIRAWGKAEGVAQDPRHERWASGPVSALCAARLSDDDADCVLYGCRDGRLVAMHRGKELWSLETGAQVNALAAGDLTGDGRPEVLVGTNGQRLLCLDAAGKELWRKEFPAFWGRLGNVMWVGTGDVDGDGNNEVVLSCENWHYYCLDGEGNQVWAFEIEHSGLEGALGDVNGDGKLETLCGQEYYGWDVLDSAGKRLFVVSGPGPITTAALAADVTGDGVPEAVFGAQTFGVYVRNGKGETVFDANVGGFVNDLALLPSPRGNLLIAAADNLGRNLAAFRADGSAAWRLSLPGQPLMLATVGDRIAAGCADGMLRVIDASGTTAEAARLEGPVAQTIAADVNADGRPEIVAAADRELVALSPTAQP